jgi:hypothetical protein
MVGLTMGRGDSWPAVDLTKAQFNARALGRIAAN